MDVKFAGRTLVCPCGEEFVFTPSGSAEQRQQQRADQEWREQFRAREKKWQEKWRRPQAEQQRAEQQRAEGARAAQSGVKSDYEILQVSINAPDEVITAAYYRLARMYHPDMVESLAPEYKQIAITRMKEINDAYGRLKARR
jgi:preprotein translocase subunit Sec63